MKLWYVIDMLQQALAQQVNSYLKPFYVSGTLHGAPYVSDALLEASAKSLSETQLKASLEASPEAPPKASPEASPKDSPEASAE